MGRGAGSKQGTGGGPGPPAAPLLPTVSLHPSTLPVPLAAAAAAAAADGGAGWRGVQRLHRDALPHPVPQLSLRGGASGGRAAWAGRGPAAQLPPLPSACRGGGSSSSSTVISCVLQKERRPRAESAHLPLPPGFGRWPFRRLPGPSCGRFSELACCIKHGWQLYPSLSERAAAPAAAARRQHRRGCGRCRFGSARYSHLFRFGRAGTLAWAGAAWPRPSPVAP